MFSSGLPYSGKLAENCYSSLKAGGIEDEALEAMVVRKFQGTVVIFNLKK